MVAKPLDAAGSEDSRQPAHRLTDVLALYPAVRDDHLRTLQKCGLIAASTIVDGERQITFSDLVVIRQVHGELQRGARFKAVLRSLLAARAGQLALDFRVDTQPAKVIALRQLESSGSAPAGRTRAGHVLKQAGVSSPSDDSLAEQYFVLASSLDDGSEETQQKAAEAYRQALEIEPRLVPALINLANIHYARDLRIEALALYELAISLEPDVFEGHFNLGNIHHDLGRYEEAEAYYVQALALNPTYAEAHLYLAVVL
ncbi:MAG: tetratricopeptide repeat protein, partial [Acidobacteria bacterium]|nr:tetratricopeptide repeat protein [Acidobacteriota bacterium]